MGIGASSSGADSYLCVSVPVDARIEVLDNTEQVFLRVMEYLQNISYRRLLRQIGGTCVELECEGARILLDMGMPLDGDDGGASLTPDVVGLHAPEASLLAVILSHGHADHWGLLPYAPVSPKVVMGAATRRILHAAAPFLPKPFKPEAFLDLVDRHPLQIGPFRITPYLVDHSAYDAYALMVEAGGRRLFYSGDIHAHGRKAGLVEKLIREPPTGINAMLMEGSSVGRLDAEAQYPTEAEIEERFVEAFEPDGFVLFRPRRRTSIGW